MSPDILAFANHLADAAADAIRPHFRKAFNIDSKDDLSPVTIADRAAEAAMRRIIEAERPEDGIIGEEYGNVREGARRLWVLDPIDGTRSFIVGRPIFGTLIALIEDGVPVVGIINQPISGERWEGAQGRPTLFNGTPCRTRTCATLAQAQVATTGPEHFRPVEREQFSQLDKAARDTIYGGDCYNYGLLASGYVDLVVEAGLKLFDFAAHIPIIEGAGGRVTDWHGNPPQTANDIALIAAGDAALIDQAVAALNSKG